MHPPKMWRDATEPHNTARKESSGRKSTFQKAMNQLYPSCIRVRSSTSGKHCVPPERQRPTAAYGYHNTAARRTAHISLHRSPLHVTETPAVWSWANAPCTRLGCAAQKGQSLLKVTLLVYRNSGKYAKPKLLKMASFSSPHSPLTWLLC